MKKVLLSAVALLTIGFANAQEEAKAEGTQTSKGKILIEANTGNEMLGTTGLSFKSQDGESEYNIGLDGGYFIMDNLALKAGLGYGGKSEDDSNTFSYRVGAKYYAMGMIPLTLDLTGASVKDAEGVKNLANILQKYQNDNPLVVISAMGKTTNALEEVARAFYLKQEDTFSQVEKVKE